MEHLLNGQFIFEIGEGEQVLCKVFMHKREKESSLNLRETARDEQTWKQTVRGLQGCRLSPWVCDAGAVVAVGVCFLPLLEDW